MPTETTYTALRENLAAVLDRVVDQQETIIVHRRKGKGDVALIPAAELSGLIETAHLLRSPKNANRLITALNRSGKRKPKPSTVAKLRREMLGAPGV